MATTRYETETHLPCEPNRLSFRYTINVTPCGRFQEDMVRAQDRKGLDFRRWSKPPASLRYRRLALLRSHRKHGLKQAPKRPLRRFRKRRCWVRTTGQGAVWEGIERASGAPTQGAGTGWSEMWLGKEVVARGRQLPRQADYAGYTVGTSRKIPARDSPEGDQVADLPRSAVPRQLTSSSLSLGRGQFISS